MSERYSRLFVLSEAVYATESPVMIESGALLKDNKTGKILAQLKMVNISDKKIKAVEVKLDCYDTAHNPIDEAVVFEFLDLDANRDDPFGAKTPIPVPNASVREFEAKVVSVVFEDQSSKSFETASWKPLPKQKELKEVLGASLSEQYKRDVSDSALYGPITFDSLWKCSCGALNHTKEHHCHSCKQEKATQFLALNHNTLAENHAAFEKAEAEKKAKEAAAAAEAGRIAAIKAEEEARAKKKEKTRTLIVISAIVIAILVVVGLVSKQKFETTQQALIGQTFAGTYRYTSRYHNATEKITLVIIDENYCNVSVKRDSDGNKHESHRENVPYTLSGGLGSIKLNWSYRDAGHGPAEPFKVIVEETNIRLSTENWNSGIGVTLD
jgi:hypothetical protein